VRACLETGLALVVHTRDAEADTMAILREEAGRGNEAGLRGVLHCFTGSRALAEDALAFGFHVSFSGILTFKKSEELRAVARIVPLDRLLVETDAPYLAPEPLRGKSNEPAYVAHTARRLAEVKGVAFEALAAATTANVERLFRGMAGTGARAAA
jgi:TatD DNase family protein